MLLSVLDITLAPEDLECDGAARVAVVRFERDAFQLDDRGLLPEREHVRSTRWYDEYKSPLVKCRLVVRGATAARFVADEPSPLFTGPEWDSERRMLVFEDVAEIDVERLDLTLEASDEIAGYLRIRIGHWLQWESEAPWE